MFDNDYIYELNKIDKQELEPLYWLIEDNLEKNNIKLCKQVYQTFIDLAKIRKSFLIKNLHSDYIQRLKELSFELYDHVSIRKNAVINIEYNIQSVELSIQKESELRDYLALHPELFVDLSSEKIKLKDVEVPTKFGFSCDLLLESDNFYYPVEIKIKKATHQVVSQIDKYCYYFYRKYRYNFHKSIQGVVVSNGFCDWSINELRKNNIICYNVSDCNGIKLKKI
jgi:RecB family endonuclease NucS